MTKPRILVVDDEDDIRDILNITLSQESYEVIEAINGEEALKMVQQKDPDLIIIDYKMPIMDGREVCRRLKKDLLLRHIPIIMLTGKREVTDKVESIDAGADDYIVKPFEPQELLARIRMMLRRIEIDLEANPLTHLPGNISIMKELQIRIDKNSPFAVAYVDLDKFKSYNDKYGFEHGDEVIRETARILIRAVSELGTPEDFIGHIGGDDFVFITSPQLIEKLCQKVIEDFNKASPEFYTPEDAKNGYIIAHNRQGEMQKFSLVSVSIGVVTNLYRKISHVAEIGEIGAELKAAAKNIEGSSYVVDQRKV